MYTNNIMSRLTELKEEEYDIVIQLLTEFTKKIQNKDVGFFVNFLPVAFFHLFNTLCKFLKFRNIKKTLKKH